MGDQSEQLQHLVVNLSGPEEILQALKGARLPRPAQAQVFVEPTTATERTVADLWAEALRLETVGVDDDFFALGGYSLLITQILSRVHDIFAVELPLDVVFTQTMTVRELARQIDLARAGGGRAGDL
jgi:hypothetical protein